MALKTVAVVSPGDMGHAVGRVLAQSGLDVITSLVGRSERTCGLARKAGIRDVGSLEEMVAQADLVLSVLVPSEAVAVAGRLATARRVTGSEALFADCNAVSPESARTMDAIIADSGGRFIDASIIGPPPGRAQQPRFYVSGEHSGVMMELDGRGIEVRSLGALVGRASGIKMCYAALTKGTSALQVALLAAADLMELSVELRAELLYSQPEAYGRMEQQIPALPVKASRWIGEMLEIADTFDHLGVTPLFHRAAADIYMHMSKMPFAQESPETVDSTRTLEQTISALARSLPRMAAPAD